MLRIINMHSGIVASVHFDPNESFVDGQIAEFDAGNNRYQVANGTGTNFSLIVDHKNGLNQSCKGNFVQVYQGNCEVETDQIDKTRVYIAGDDLYISPTGMLTNIPSTYIVARVLRITANMYLQVDWFGLLPVQNKKSSILSGLFNSPTATPTGFTQVKINGFKSTMETLNTPPVKSNVHNGMNCNNCKEFNEYITSPNCGENYICYYCRKHVLFI